MDNYIDINNITFEYKKGRAVFKNFSVKISPMETTVIIGKNGSGKTTLTKLIMGILKPLEGTISIFGDNVKDLTLGQIGQRIGYVSQYPERQLFAQSVFDELTFTSIFKKDKEDIVNQRAEELIRLFELDKVRDSYPFQLSYGEKKRLVIAAVLMNNPSYLILDEPTASLDSRRIDILSDILYRLKETNINLLIISHDKSFIKKHGQRIINIE